MKYTIYQSEHPTFLVDGDKKKEYKKEDYKITYQGELTEDELRYDDAYETVFYIFNMEHPKDFKSYSLSTGDIVEIDGVAKIVAKFGFKKIELV